MSDWIKWDGGYRPVDRNQPVIVKHRDGWVSGVPVFPSDWRHSPPGRSRMDDIVAYALVPAALQQTPA